MKKIIFLSLFFANFCLNAAEFNMPQYESPLLEVEDGYGKILNHPDIIVGSSGIVMHSLSNGDSSIVARIVVTEKEGTFAKVRFEMYDGTKQKALPLPKILPQKNDKVILNYLYSRSLIVVPNGEIYNQVVNAFPNITFIHPDITGAHLLFDNKPNPSRDDFRKMCSNNATGLIFIALNEESYFADCGSFMPLKKFQTGKVASYQVPFYTRVGDIKEMVFDFKNSPIRNYNAHYRYLLGLKNER